MLTEASFSVGFTYGYSRCPASRDATHIAGLTEGGSYLSEYGPLAWAVLDRPFGAQYAVPKLIAAMQRSSLLLCLPREA